MHKTSIRGLKILTDLKKSWYALRVKSNRERVTTEALKGKGFAVCLPLYRERSRRTDRIQTIELPLFPGYLFCSFEVSNRLPILTVPGVVHIVSIGKTPQPVDETEMTAVFAVIKSGLRVMPAPYLPVGQRILLDRGPLSGVEGVIVAHKNEEQFIVSVSLLQRSIAVEVDRDWISTIGSSPQQLVRANGS
jgi:transcription antitermination factor NusG